MKYNLLWLQVNERVVSILLEQNSGFCLSTSWGDGCFGVDFPCENSSGEQYTFYDKDFYSTWAALTVFKLAINIFHFKN